MPDTTISPCPLCGSPATAFWGAADPESAYITCTGCWLYYRGPFSDLATDEPPTLEAKIAIWNAAWEKQQVAERRLAELLRLEQENTALRESLSLRNNA